MNDFVLHFSEDVTTTRFVPHVAATITEIDTICPELLGAS